MTMTIENARIRIARELLDAEVALEEALVRQTSLLATLVAARREVGEHSVQGQDVLMRLARSNQSLLSASSDLARVHARLLEINRETGDLVSDCPDNWRKWSHSDDSIAA